MAVKSFLNIHSTKNVLKYSKDATINANFKLMVATIVTSLSFLFCFVVNHWQDYSPISSLLTTEQYCLLDTPGICLAMA